jgi:hypothetical protein
VHLYGPRLGEIDGRDYDPSQNYVHNRPEGEVRDTQSDRRQELPARRSR